MSDHSSRAGDLDGRVIMVTGGSSGIGAAAVRAFRRRGARVLLTGRSPRTLEIAAETGAEARLVDYADFASVRELADYVLATHSRLDVLCNNAGTMSATRQLTVDGHERVFQANHLSPFLLTALLTPLLEASGGRVIATASIGHLYGRIDYADLDRARRYESFAAYATSKLMNMLHMRALARRHPAIAAASFHPGTVATELAREGSWKEKIAFSGLSRRLFLIPPEKGADTMIWLATSTPDRDWQSGGYYAKRRRAFMLPGVNDANAERLWEASSRLVGLT